jgi:hypothetical protein
LAVLDKEKIGSTEMISPGILCLKDSALLNPLLILKILAKDKIKRETRDTAIMGIIILWIFFIKIKTINIKRIAKINKFRVISEKE